MSIAQNIENLFMSRLLAASPEECLQIAMTKNKKKVTNINTILQLEQGEDANGRKLKEYKKYSIKKKDKHILKAGGKEGEEYADFKARKNRKPGYGTPDLKLSGKFYKGFDLKAGLELSVISADDPHDLEGQYGRDIFGIQKDNLPILAAYIKPELEKQYKRQVLRK